MEKQQYATLGTLSLEFVSDGFVSVERACAVNQRARATAEFSFSAAPLGLFFEQTSSAP
jgi:hypothetical protein